MPRVHEVTFERIEDAAAFIAAVSRHAASPDAPRASDLRVDVELLAPGARVYLSDAVLRVAEWAFGPVPRISSDDVPAGPPRLTIDITQPLGMETIVWRLSAHYHGLRNHVVA